MNDVLPIANLGALEIEMILARGRVCELCQRLKENPMSNPATHRVTFDDTGVQVLLCNVHAIGVVALAEWIQNG